MPDFMLPPLSQRLRQALRKLTADESHITTRLHTERGFKAPDLLRETTNLVEKALISILEEIEKGPGSTRLW